MAGPSVHVHGDQFRRWIVNGRTEMTPEPSREAVEQLRLRHRLTAAVCTGYAEAGFTVVVLTPRPDVVADRELGRGKNSYGRWTIDALDRGLRTETPCIGLWLDTSELTVEQTAAEILRRSSEALVADRPVRDER